MTSICSVITHPIPDVVLAYTHIPWTAPELYSHMPDIWTTVCQNRFGEEDVCWYMAYIHFK